MIGVTQSEGDLEKHIHSLRINLAIAYAAYINALDEQKDWPKIIESAKTAGLSKDILCRELGCAWSTIIRWQTGRSAPGQFARKNIKEKLVEMLNAYAGVIPL